LITVVDNTTEITTLKFSGDGTQQTTAFTNSLKTDLSNNTTKLTDVSYTPNKTTIANNLECNNITGNTITNINNSISSKQDTLNASTNKLNPSFIDGGSSLTSQKIGWLSSIAQDLQSKLDALQSSIDALVTADTEQTTLNTSLANSINTLTTGKQDLLNSTSNKLNCANLNAGTGTMSNLKMQYLSTIGGDITDALNSKQNTITDGSLTIARTNGLQAAIDSKWNTPANATNLGYVDIASNLTGLLNAKQNTITDGSLTIARTSGLQAALNSKITSGGGADFGGGIISNFIYPFNDLGTIAANRACDGSEYSKINVFNTTAARTITLPNASGLWDGIWMTFTCLNKTAVAITFKNFAATTIYTMTTTANNTGTTITFIYSTNATAQTQSGGWILM
jgi:outer membrane murein-binding lipoprotein Lpp